MYKYFTILPLERAFLSRRTKTTTSTNSNSVKHVQFFKYITTTKCIRMQSYRKLRMIRVRAEPIQFRFNLNETIFSVVQLLPFLLDK